MSDLPHAAATEDETMWTRLNLRLLSSTGTIALLVTIVEAGRKWH